MSVTASPQERRALPTLAGDPPSASSVPVWLASVSALQRIGGAVASGVPLAKADAVAWAVFRYQVCRWSTTRVADELDVSAATVSSWLRRRGVAVRPPGGAMAVEASLRRAERGWPDARLVAAARAGRSARQISADTGVAFDSVRAVLSRAGAVGAAPLSRLRYVPDAELVAAYRDGESVASLARRYATKPTTVRRRLVDAGVEVAPRRGRVAGRDWSRVLTRDYLAARRAAGASVNAIARDVGCAHGTVTAALRRHGVD